MRARDLFAGVGWGMAARELGIEDWGWDNDPAVNRAREANGLRVAGLDVLDVDGGQGGFEIEIASPTCERFSTTGVGDGNMVVLHVQQAVSLMAENRLGAARALLRRFHPKIALVLEPLRVVMENDSARHVVWEQVPSVLPIWRECAKVLRCDGWSVATGVVDAAWYLTPQNRRRAVLIARKDGKAAAIPEPTGFVNLGIAFPELPRDWWWRSNNNTKYDGEYDRLIRSMRQCAGTITRRAWNWQRGDCTLLPAPPSHSARIQGFPADMAWPGLIIGNAVPVGMAEALLRAAVL